MAMAALSVAHHQLSKKGKKQLPVADINVSMFHRVFGCFLARGVQRHYKTKLQKNRVEKFLQKIHNRFLLGFANPDQTLLDMCAGAAAPTCEHSYCKTS
jgi:hypothetical protein